LGRRRFLFLPAQRRQRLGSLGERFNRGRGEEEAAGRERDGVAAARGEEGRVVWAVERGLEQPLRAVAAPKVAAGELSDVPVGALVEAACAKLGYIRAILFVAGG